MEKKGIVLGVLIFSLILFGCTPQTGTTDETEVFVSFFNETGEEPTVVVIEEDAPPVTGEVILEEPVDEVTEEPLEEVIDEPVDEVTEEPLEEVIDGPVEVIDTPAGIPVKNYGEGDLVELSVTALDPDNDDLIITYSEPLSEDGTWQTVEGDAGQYRVEITVSDGEAIITKEVLLMIEPKNKAPVIDIIKEITVNEGETVTLAPVITDSDNDPVTITYTGWMDSSEYVTSFDDTGSYIVTIIASDGKTSVAKDIKVNVVNVNRPPAILSINPITVIEGALITVSPVVTDLDDDQITVTFSDPIGEDGTWQTVEGDEGGYEVAVTATDGIAIATETFKVTVTPVNRAPVIQRITDITVKEGETVNIEPVTIDPDGDSYTIAYSGWMTTNSKPTGFDDAGDYIVTVTATDSKGAAGSIDVKIIVENMNRPPELIIE